MCELLLMMGFLSLSLNLNHYTKKAKKLQGEYKGITEHFLEVFRERKEPQ